MASDDEEKQERRSRSRHRKRQRRKRRNASSDSDSSESSITRSPSKSRKRRKHRRHHHHRRDHKSRRRMHRSSRRRSSSRMQVRVNRGNPDNIGDGREKQKLIDSMGSPPTVVSLTPAPVEMPTVPESRIEPNEAVPQPVQQQLSRDTIPNVDNNATHITVNDISQLLQTLVQPNTIKYDRNIIPTFDPAQQNQRIENWIAKVNECAQIYKWTDTQTTHFALPKLAGHARKWYEGLQTILLTWAEWQDRLIKAFPSETNYGVVLSEMLERRLRPGESVDEYYYDKITLLNVCEIVGKKAVDCLIHGIDDRMIRASASSARYKEPEDLLKFLKDLGKENHLRLSKKPLGIVQDIVCFKCHKTGHRSNQCRSSASGTNELTCYNCREKGHVSSKCTKPRVTCNICNRFGHTSDVCFRKSFISQQPNANKPIEKKTLLTQSTNPDSKYCKQVTINKTIDVKCYVDFGSDVTLISKDIIDSNTLPISENDLPNIRGFGNSTYTPLGKTRVNLRLGEVAADIDMYIVEPSLLLEPILVGQNFTERPDVLVIKTCEQLDILKRNLPKHLTSLETDSELNEKVVLRIQTDTNISKIDFVGCTSEKDLNCEILVENSVRNFENTDYCVVGGIYSVHEGECQVVVCNLSGKTLPLVKNEVLTRAKVITASKPPSSQLACNRISDQSSLKPIAREEININKALSVSQSNKILDLLNKYRACFAQNLTELGCTDLTEMIIELNDTTPVVHRPYRLSYTERKIVRDMVKELIDNDIAEESNSFYASPIILVSKKTGGYRLCVDFRALNHKTKKDHYPMPRIDDQLDMLNGNKYYSSLDLVSGYYQIPIHEDYRHLTAFITPDGLYQFKKMPFGLVNSPAVFQRTINKVLGNSRFNSALAYMDDILIPGKDFEEGLNRLEDSLQLLQNAGLTLNLSKCNFFLENIEYLGYEISEEGIRPGKGKIVAVEQFPTPQSVHEVRQFIGLASYFRKFIENFATIARPLTDLTRKTSSWQWGADQEKAFSQLKSSLVLRPLLGIYDPTSETFLHTDASKHGLAGILIQKENDTENNKPIAYFSRKTTTDEQNYHAYELETLAVVVSLQRFRVYLLGLKFTLITDCSALRATFTKRDLIPRVARWWISLQEFNFEIQYRPGSSMSHVDALSRNPQPCESEVDYDKILPSIMRITQDDWLLSLQLGDSKIQHIRKVLEDKDCSDIKKNYVIKNNRLYRNVGSELKWVVPKMARFQLCKRNHDDIGHFSVEKTLDKISKDFWFPKMKRFVRKYVRSCLECAFSKEPAGPKEGLLHPIHKVDKPFDTVHIDHLGPFVKSSKGHCYLLVLVDGFTKYCLLKPLRNLKSALTIRALEDIFNSFGYPNRMISDQGTSFTSKEFQHFCNDSKVNHILNAVASPRANGQVERYNRTVLDALTTYTDKLGERYWDRELGKLQWGLNNTLNKGIGKTPAEALFGTQMNSKGDNIFYEILKETRRPIVLDEVREQISTHIQKDQLTQKMRFDKCKIKAKVYKEGDLVKILKPVSGNDGKSKKLLSKFSGPFRITKVLENDRYEVSSITGTKITQKDYCNVWAADRIKPWITTHCSDDSKSSCSSGTE